jgi:hypothetical protein
VITPPASAPGTKAMQAAIVVLRPPVWPVGPIVSTTESPHGENVPVAPISSAAAARLISISTERACRST